MNSLSLKCKIKLIALMLLPLFITMCSPSPTCAALLHSLTEETESGLSSDDLSYIVVDPSGTPVDRKVTLENLGDYLFANVPATAITFPSSIYTPDSNGTRIGTRTIGSYTNNNDFTINSDDDMRFNLDNGMRFLIYSKAGTFYQGESFGYGGYAVNPYGNEFVIGPSSTQNYDHAPAYDTLYVHATAPDTDNTHYISLNHDTVDGRLEVGTGIIKTNAGMSIDGDLTVTSGNTINTDTIQDLNGNGSIDLSGGVVVSGDLTVSGAGNIYANAIRDVNGSGAVEISGDVNVSDSLTITNNVFFTNLPTSDPTEAGRVWNDSGTLKVSAG